MIEPLSLLTAFLLGLFGSSHCLVMCGGIAAALGARATDNRLQAALLFNSGRILSYVVAGVLVSFLGLWLHDLHSVLMLSLRTIAALLLILMGLYVARWSMVLTHVERLGQRLWVHLQPRTVRFMQSERLIDQFRLGLLWGWLPCGLIYSTLAWVAGNGNPTLGALAMLAFGLGTLPALLASTLAGSLLARGLAHPFIKPLAGVFLISMGLWSLITLWAHP